MVSLLEDNCLLSGVKTYLALHRDDIVRPPPGITKAEHRADFMLRAAKYIMSTKVTPELCDSEAAHTLSFHARVYQTQLLHGGLSVHVPPLKT
ncbi:hypothetical protein PHPALM_31898 [Phytophthora palmivora]|uniref:Uncharacterized protein n=1 Tax=Phytophthora palmivora TaxID=4796 RepID=A0A2P4X1F7_9STRA|nr:hypothetical protein PHPALM_31898 [Phytophthora palmivora]